MNISNGTELLGGGSKSKKLPQFKVRKNLIYRNQSAEMPSAETITQNAKMVAGGKALQSVINEAKKLRSKMSGGDVAFVDTALDQLSTLIPMANDGNRFFNSLLSNVNFLFDGMKDTYASDVEFIDLQSKFRDIKTDRNPNYAEVDTQDLIEVTRKLLRDYMLKKRPTVHVYDYGRAINNSVNNFLKNINSKCPPINAPNKTEQFIDPDGYLSCRVKLSKRAALRGVMPDKCPPFPGSRRTQYHVQHDGTAVCREPVKTGAHECPEPIFRDPYGDESKTVYADPLATVHETLPGGVGICRRPFSMPSLITSSPTVLPAKLNAPMSLTAKLSPFGAIADKSSGVAHSSVNSARKSRKHRSPKKSSGKKSSPRRLGSKNRQ